MPVLGHMQDSGVHQPKWLLCMFAVEGEGARLYSSLLWCESRRAIWGCKDCQCAAPPHAGHVYWLEYHNLLDHQGAGIWPCYTVYHQVVL